VIAVRYFETGALTPYDMREVEAAAARAEANGTLAVTNVSVPKDVVDYGRDARGAGRLIDAVTWVDSRHDGLLQRALVSLVR
jgi:hypothetical protein